MKRQSTVYMGTPGPEFWPKPVEYKPGVFARLFFVGAVLGGSLWILVGLAALAAPKRTAYPRPVHIVSYPGASLPFYAEPEVSAFEQSIRGAEINLGLRLRNGDPLPGSVDMTLTERLADIEAYSIPRR